MIYTFIASHQRWASTANCSKLTNAALSQTLAGTCQVHCSVSPHRTTLYFVLVCCDLIFVLSLFVFPAQTSLTRGVVQPRSVCCHLCGIHTLIWISFAVFFPVCVSWCIENWCLYLCACVRLWCAGWKNGFMDRKYGTLDLPKRTEQMKGIWYVMVWYVKEVVLSTIWRGSTIIGWG